VVSAAIPLIAAELLEDERSRRDPAVVAIWELLEAVKDPEIPVLSIADLGILRAVHREGGELRVVITPTYSGCPAMRAIEDEVRAVLTAAGYGAVQVQSRLAPAWTTDWMSEAGRARLRDYGIAPPVPGSGGLHAETARPECPRCGSAQTRRISEFGSTACKALYQCGECHEPFDYFKCI
jgi:ring-1,2-phenylacetyl-CoA epoxidase subunit PaaD